MLLARYANWNRPCSMLWRRLRLQRVKMRTDAINMEVNEGLLAFFAEEEDEESLLRGNWSGSQRPRIVRRWLEPSLLNGALAE